ncbi:unnamed protein product [Angiostrongylus costaricensis]|uniref:histone acetyltransferase n=1 Tax=Angiostrongylus costaricensis TaxID=334426 RepID=A0A0R3PEN8_ANGCS|nr:unnamed protein product [Angiostrongylus costaricensis]
MGFFISSEDIIGAEVCFFGIYVQEYGINYNEPNARSRNKEENLEKNSGVFFTIRLVPQQFDFLLPDIVGADPFMASEMMEDRNTFLTRILNSSIMFCIERLGWKQDMSYTCNKCNGFNVKWQCTTCDVKLCSVFDARMPMERRKLPSCAFSQNETCYAIRKDKHGTCG